MTDQFEGLSSFSKKDIEIISKKRIIVIVSEYHKNITGVLYRGAHEILLRAGIKSENIIKKIVPGAFEIPLVAQYMISDNRNDAIICLGCLIRGETEHFRFISQAVAYGLTKIALQYQKPIAFGILTTQNFQQALDRAGGKHGNKGIESAVAILQMLKNYN